MRVPVEAAVNEVGGHPDKPTLSAPPSSIIPQGEHVVLKCDSSQGFDAFQLYKEDRSHVPEIEDRIFQKDVLLGPVTPTHAGSYRCSSSFLHSPHRFSAPSDPLVLTITGIYRKPFLLAQPGPLVKSREKVTLQCVSQIRFETFILVLHRDGVAQELLSLTGDPQDENSQANFSIDPVTATHAGTYRCYGSLSDSPYEWSAPSDPLDLVVTGLHKKPFLSVQLDPGASRGGNVTLSCSSELPFDVFHLSRERQGRPLRHQAAAQRGELMFQADFLLGPRAHSATYRCYGSFRGSRHVWTAPSDPVHLSVTGEQAQSEGNEGLSVRGASGVERRAGRLQSRLIPPGSPYGDPQSQAAGRGGAVPSNRPMPMLPPRGPSLSPGVGRDIGPGQALGVSALQRGPSQIGLCSPLRGYREGGKVRRRRAWEWTGVADRKAARVSSARRGRPRVYSGSTGGSPGVGQLIMLLTPAPVPALHPGLRALGSQAPLRQHLRHFPRSVSPQTPTDTRGS
nr:putative killer cell immunoglobulin-like receptor like protein KIR3DP1 [Cavia porcellus]